MVPNLVLSLLAFAVTTVSAARWHTTATYTNNPPSVIGADPYVRWDAKTKQYYAYSTEGADEGWHFGIYSSPDLNTWTKASSGALKADAADNWADDWYWANECYFNEKTGWYFLFYAGRMLKPENVTQYFTYPDFEEASKVGVAVSRSPSGPFVNIEPRPIDYFPYDPDYHDVNLIMSPPYLSPPKSQEDGQKAPLGTYIPFIDPNVFFDDGKIWLYFSRNAYRNWVWDDALGKYVEESNIYVVQLDDAWWNDPQAKTLPRVHKKYRDVHRDPLANSTAGGPTRRDGWTAVISSKLQPQVWENAHTNDHAISNGTLKDRRWSEGSTTIKRVDSQGHSIYFLVYSSNNFASPTYGVGYAFSDRPDGPFVKSTSNPILSQDPSKNIYSTGHGSIVSAQNNNREFFYPHHARPTPDSPRYLYTSRLYIDADTLHIGFGPVAGDLSFPSGVAPIKLSAEKTGDNKYTVTVRSADGAAFDLASPKNRVRVLLDGVEGGVVEGASVSLDGTSRNVTIRYQRARANASEPWQDVQQWQGPGLTGRREFVDVHL